MPHFPRSNVFALPLKAVHEFPVEEPADAKRVPTNIGELVERLDAVRAYAASVEERFAVHVEAAGPRFRGSARNLLHYLALRHFDLRGIQEHLGALGLCTLGQVESRTLASLYAVREALERAAGTQVHRDLEPPPGVAFHEGPTLLEDNTDALLGGRPQGRRVRIMVTFPSEAASDYDLVRDLVATGMDCARLNCSQDDEHEWKAMVRHVERARVEVGRPCKIFMDLAGPKLRIGRLEPGPRVLHWSPPRDPRGRPLAPARIWLGVGGAPPPEGLDVDAVVPTKGEWLDAACTGDRVAFIDAREAPRILELVQCLDQGAVGEGWDSAYIETGTPLELRRPEASGAEQQIGTARVGKLRRVDVPLMLHEGDTLILYREPRAGRPAIRDADGTVLEPARVSCTMPEVFDTVRVGQPVIFDDGKVEGVVREISSEEMVVAVTLAKPEGSRLRGDKGVNFPETRLGVPAVTPKDLADLDFVVRHADLVGMSFVNEPKDVLMLQDELRARGAEGLGLVLKIETKRGFRQLPWLLLAAMRSYPTGIMIARGDLAVECGWEKLAELQEEILWLCEAAHVPVIWATQVLEKLAKKGFPSRAEITDAAMAERAECVMLNKGPYITKAVTTLDHILGRMEEHQGKKSPKLRRLTLAGDL